MTVTEDRLRRAWVATEDLISPTVPRTAKLDAQRGSKSGWRTPILAAAVTLLILVPSTLELRGAARHPGSGTRPSEAVPAAIRSTVQAEISANAVHPIGEPVQWVQTTWGRWRQSTKQTGPTELPDRSPIYVVEIRGDFVCRTCFGVAVLPSGTVVTYVLSMASASQIREYQLGRTLTNLHTLGAVHTFTP